MAVPETAVHEHRRAVARQDDIGAAGQIAAVHTEAEPLTMQQPAHRHFGFGILCPNPAHIEPPLVRR